MICCFSIRFSVATPSYVGVSEDEEDIWEISFDSSAYSTWISDGGSSTIFTTSQAWNYYNKVGFKFIITDISSEQSFGSPLNGMGVEITANSYQTTEPISNDKWDLMSSGSSLKLLSAIDIDENNILYMLWTHSPCYYPTNGFWYTAMADLKTALLATYPSITTISDNSNDHGVFFGIDYNSIPNDLDLEIFFDSNGVLDTYSATYLGNEIISLTLKSSTTPSDENPENPGIFSYPLSIIVGLISTVTIIIILKKASSLKYI